MSQNNCAPSSVFGGFDRYLFLGCSISKFTTSVGWNTESSSLTCEIVQDSCAGDTRIYYDENLNEFQTTSGDRGFLVSGVLPKIGSPAFFKVGDFEYCGLIQNYQEQDSQSGKPVYTVTLTDPRDILASTQLILDDYSGSSLNLYNLINCFGFMEQFGTTCPPAVINGASFGNLSGGFGGSFANDNGIQYNRLLPAIGILTSAIPNAANAFSPYGRIIFQGANPGNNGYGNIKADFFDPTVTIDFDQHDGYLSEYFLDLSDMPVMPDYYRVPGTNISVLDLISQVCDDAGHDFFIELVPVFLGSSVLKIIKVRTVSRRSQPILGEIEDFIATSFGTSQTSVGRELRLEPTSSLLIGGNRQTLFQVDQDLGEDGELDDIISPFFGLDSSGNAIIAEKDDDGNFLIPVSLTALNIQLHTPLAADSIRLDERELLAALAGPDSWLTFAAAVPTELGALLPINGIWDPGPFLAVFDALSAGKLFPRDFVTLNNADRAKADEISKDIDLIYNFVMNYARDFYGKKFMVRIPYTCVNYDLETQRPIFADEPSDGGWTETNTVLDLPHPTVFTDFFSLDDGRVGPIFKFSDATTVDVSNLDENDFGMLDSILYVRGNIDKEFVFADKANFISPRAVMTLPQAVLEKPDPADFGKFMRGLDMLFKVLGAGPDPDINAKIADVAKKVGNQVMNMGAELKALVPDAAAVPLKSNVSTYGPWAIRGPAGPTKVVKNEDLVPWSYGSVENMDAAGFALVEEDVTQMQIGEMGSITVPGYPIVGLGNEIGAVAGGYFGGGQNLLFTRTLLTLDFSEEGSSGQVDHTYARVDFPAFTGLFGPNITGITVDVGSQGLTTTYSFRTFSRKYGVLAKQNAERLKSLGTLRLRQARENRHLALQQFRGAFALKNAVDRRGRLFDRPFADDSHSPAEILIGQTTSFETSYRRNCVVLHNVAESVSEAQQYDKKAFMSLDGLVTPVSMDGSGDLPPYGIPVGSQCIPHQTIAPESPIDQWVPPVIAQPYLNPFTNPVGFARDDKHGSSDGHDIEILARGTGAHVALGIQMDREGGGDGYDDDYRMMAMRGPILLQSWGYDLQGKPVPNQADTEIAASGGSFETTFLEDTFMDDWLRKRHTWPVGPIDLRWDRIRGVWTIPPSMRFQHAILTSCLDAFSTATALAYNGPTVYGDTGTAIPNLSKTITITDINGVCLPAGTRVTVYYDTFNCRYYLVDWPFTISNGHDCTGVTGAPFCVSRIDFGKGLTVLDLGCGIKQVNTVLKLEEGSETDCIENRAAVDPLITLSLGQGLSSRADGDCKATIGVCIPTDEHQDCITENTLGCFSKLSLGPGLKVEVADCEAKLALCMPVKEGAGGVENCTNTLTFCADSFDVTNSACETTVCTVGASGTFSVVCGVECSGSSLVVSTRTITVLNGLITDIGTCSI